MALVVQKYGGTSVANTERLEAVAKHVQKTKQEGNDVVVVVSAPSGFTDDMVRRAHEISELPSPREYDMLLSTGEQISIALLAMALHELGEDAISLTAGQMQIRTDKAHTRARILSIDLERVRSELEKNRIVIVAGFQGRTSEGEITTLGRGGSDTTAVAIAAAIDADLCEIYTDVDGVYTADPRRVKNPSKLKEISYDEMIELASLGAKVLHPRSVEVAKTHQVTLAVRSSFDTNIGGTFVVEAKELETKYAVTGIACDKNVAKIGVFGVPDSPGVAAALFSALGDAEVNVDMIMQSSMHNGTNDIAFTVPRNDLKRAAQIVESLRDTVEYHYTRYEDDVVKISAVGAGMVSSHGIAAKMFQTLSSANINIESISTSEIKISCIIKDDGDQLDIAMQSLHDAFGLSDIS